MKAVDFTISLRIVRVCIEGLLERFCNLLNRLVCVRLHLLRR